MKLPNRGFTAMAALSAVALFVPIDAAAAGTAKKGDGSAVCDYSDFQYIAGVLTLFCNTPQSNPTATNDTFAFNLPTYNVQSSATATTTATIAVNFTRVTFPATNAGGVYLLVGSPCLPASPLGASQYASVSFPAGVSQNNVGVIVPMSAAAGSCTVTLTGGPPTPGTATIGSAATIAYSTTATTTPTPPTPTPPTPAGCPTVTAPLNQTPLKDNAGNVVTGYRTAGFETIFTDSASMGQIFAIPFPTVNGVQVAAARITFVGYLNYPQTIEAALAPCPGDFSYSLSADAATNQYNQTWQPCHAYGDGGVLGHLYYNTAGDYLTCKVPNDGRTWYVNLRYVGSATANSGYGCPVGSCSSTTTWGPN